MEEKVKIDFKNKALTNVKIGDASIKIKPWLNMNEIVFIADESCAYFKDLISQNQGDAIALSFTLAKMKMLIVALATNLDIDDVEADTLGASGIFNIIEEKVLNYNMIKDIVLAGINMIGNGLIIEQLSHIASLDDLEKAQDKIDGYMQNDEYSDKVKGLIEVMLANNPMVAKELNGMISSGDDNKNGNKE